MDCHLCERLLDQGKRVAETLMMDYHRQINVDIRIIRRFSTYGPCMTKKGGRMVSNLMLQVHRNQDITVFGYTDHPHAHASLDLADQAADESFYDKLLLEDVFFTDIGFDKSKLC